MPKYVKCPDSFAPLFDSAEAAIEPLLGNYTRSPEEGDIIIGDERFVLNRAKSMATALMDQLKSVLGPSAGVVIYQIGKAVGASDAKFVFEKTGIIDHGLRLAMGPVTFAFNALGAVEIRPESSPSPNEDFLLVTIHTHAYEAEANIAAGLKQTSPIDFYSAGYAAGWCSEAFDLKLDAKEISCRAAGDDNCLFVVAPTSRLRDRIKEIKEIYSL